VLAQCADRASLYVDGKFKFIKYRPDDQDRFKVKVVARRPPPLGPRAAALSEDRKSKLLEHFLHALPAPSVLGRDPTVDDDLSFEGYEALVAALAHEKKLPVPPKEDLARIFQEV
jgi:hypothetical protein